MKFAFALKVHCPGLPTLVFAGLLALGLGFGPAPAWAIGAIAVDDEEGMKASDVGYGVGYGDTKEAAQAQALKECRKAGNTGCKVVVWYEKCGAYAVSKTNYGFGYGATEAAAKQAALDQCSGSCRVAVSDCGE